MGGNEPPGGCWELDLDPLQEQVCLSAEPSLQTPELYFLSKLQILIFRIAIYYMLLQKGKPLNRLMNYLNCVNGSN